MAFDLILTIAILGLLSVPGILCYRLLYSREKYEDCVINGIAWGLATSVVLIYLCSHAKLMLFLIPWSAAGIAVTYLWFQQRRAPSIRVAPARKQIWGILAGLAIVVVLSRSVPLMMFELPLGYDPKFNMILVNKAIVLQHHFADWKPFYDVQLNYPIGSHLLVAFVATLGRIDAHRVYGFMVPIFGALLALQLYILAKRTTRSPQIAVWSSVLVGLVAVLGAIGYGFWNGLPNLIGMYFLLLSLTILADPRVSRRRIVAFGFCFVAIFLTHHHVMITACAIYLGLFILFLCSKANRPKAWGMVVSGAVALLIGGIYMIPYALKIVQLGDTDVMRFREPFFGIARLAESLGYAFAITVVVGAIVYTARVMMKRQRFDHGWHFIATVTGVLIGLFVGFSYIYRAYAKAKYGQDWVAFTPSRFLTDATPFLAIFAAYGLVNAIRKISIPPVVQVLILVALATTNYSVWRRLCDGSGLPSHAVQEAYRVIRNRTNKNAVVLTTDQWAPYCTRRRTMYFPLPISERAKQLPTYTATINRKLGNPLKEPPLGYPLLAVGDPRRFKLPHNVLWEHESGLTVVEVVLPEAPKKSNSTDR